MASLGVTVPTPGTYQITSGEPFYVWMLKLAGKLFLDDYWQPEGLEATYAAFNSGAANVIAMRATIGGTAYPERGRLGFNNWAWHYEVRPGEFTDQNPNVAGIRPNAIRYIFYRDVFKASLNP